MVVIVDHYPMTTMNENINWMKLTHLLSNFCLTLRPPLYIYMNFKFLNTIFKCTHYKKNLDLSLTYTRYLLTLTLVHAWYEESTPWECATFSPHKPFDFPNFEFDSSSRGFAQITWIGSEGIANDMSNGGSV